MGVVWKEEFKFATTHIIAEDMPEITALSDGRFLATWRTGEFSGGDIFNYSDIHYFGRHEEPGEPCRRLL
jgi:hypothetical protein